MPRQFHHTHTVQRHKHTHTCYARTQTQCGLSTSPAASVNVDWILLVSFFCVCTVSFCVSVCAVCDVVLLFCVALANSTSLGTADPQGTRGVTPINDMRSIANRNCWREDGRKQKTTKHTNEKHVKRNDALSKYRTFYARIFYEAAGTYKLRHKCNKSICNRAFTDLSLWSHNAFVYRIIHKAHTKHTYFRLLTSLPLVESVCLASKIFQLKLHRITVFL